MTDVVVLNFTQSCPEGKVMTQQVDVRAATVTRPKADKIAIKPLT